MRAALLMLALCSACSSSVAPLEDLGQLEDAGAGDQAADRGTDPSCAELGDACGTCCAELICGPAYVGASTDRACLQACSSAPDCPPAHSCMVVDVDGAFRGACVPIPQALTPTDPSGHPALARPTPPRVNGQDHGLASALPDAGGHPTAPIECPHAVCRSSAMGASRKGEFRCPPRVRPSLVQRQA